jgi:hypothetical protein
VLFQDRAEDAPVPTPHCIASSTENSAPSKARRRPSSRHGSDALPTALTQTLRVVLKHFSKRGVTQAQLRRAVEDASKTFDQPITGSDSPALAAMQGRIDLLATWHRDARFLDDDGKPRVLSLKGSPSLGELFNKHRRDERSNGRPQRLANEGVIGRAGRNGWFPSKRTLIVSSDSPSALLRLPGQIDALLSTPLHNGKAKGNTARRLERTVFVDRFPSDMLPAFDPQTQRLGGQLIDEMDNWLLRREALAENAAASLRVGVTMFAFLVRTKSLRAAEKAIPRDS